MHAFLDRHHLLAIKHVAFHVLVAALFAVFFVVVLLKPERAYAGECDVTGVTWPGNEAFNSTIPLQMPFVAGQIWRVGGDGSFYGNGLHCSPNNDYYATDWNRADGADLGSAVLPIAKGSVVTANCVGGTGYGCSVVIDHANGFRTRYAHLNDIVVDPGAVVDTWTLIGHVGKTGTSDEHLHLSFLHYDNGGYFSKCWNNGFACIQGNPPYQPQGYRPSSMMSASGPTILQDGGTYTSVNGRVQLPDLRAVNGWTTYLYLRNDSPEYRQLNVYFFNQSGVYVSNVSCDLYPSQMCLLWSVSTNGSAYVDGGEAASVVAQRFRTSPQVYAIHKGINRPDSQLLLPLLHRYNNGTSSKVMIRNASTTGHTVTIRFQTSSGEVCPQNYYLGTNVAVTIDMKWVSCLTNGVYGARITSDSGQPIAAVTTQELDANNDGIPESMMDYEGFPDGS